MLVEESAGTIAAVNTRLTNQYPTFGAYLEQTRERIAFTPTVLTHRIISSIAGLVTRRSTGKATHGFRLRTQERGCSLRKQETAGLSHHHCALGIPNRKYLIAVSHIAVTNTEDDIKYRTVVLREMTNGFIGLILHLLLFDIAGEIMILYRGGCTLSHGETSGQVTEIGLESQRGFLQEHLIFVGYLIGGNAVGITNGYNDLLVRTAYLEVFSHCGEPS